MCVVRTLIIYSLSRFQVYCWCYCSVSRLCPSLCNPMDYSTPGLSVPHHLPEFAQVHVHWIGDVIQPSHLLLPSSPFAFSLSQDQGLFLWVSCVHQVVKVLELQLQHQSFQFHFIQVYNIVLLTWVTLLCLTPPELIHLITESLYTLTITTSEMQVKTIMRYHSTPVRMAFIKKTRHSMCCRDVEKRESLYTIGGRGHWCVCAVENSMEVPVHF